MRAHGLLCPNVVLSLTTRAKSRLDPLGPRALAAASAALVRALMASRSCSASVKFSQRRSRSRRTV